MVEDQGEQDVGKFDITTEGDVPGNISPDQARVLGLRHASDNCDSNERPCRRRPQHAQDKETRT